MKFTLSRVGTLSKRTDETVRFPTVGLLNADYLIQDQNKQDAGKARVDDGVITAFAMRSDLPVAEKTRVQDMLLRGIVEDADSQNANLSIQLHVGEFSLLEMKRFFERFGFRGVSETIMKRNAGSIHPTSIAEARKWARRLGLVEGEGPNPDFYFLNPHRSAMDKMREQIIAKAEQYVKTQLQKLHQMMPGHTFEYLNAQGSEFVSMEPPIIDTQHGDNFGPGDLKDIQARYEMMAEQGQRLPPGILMIGPVLENIFELNAYLEEHFGIELDTVKLDTPSGANARIRQPKPQRPF